MSKCGLLTFHRSDNYGSVLQAYALSTYINKNICSCEIIDYRKPEVKDLYKIFQPLNSRYNLFTDIYRLLYLHKFTEKKKNFESFRSQMRISDSLYTEYDQLKKLTQYDFYISGSDQIWNFDLLDFDPAYVLEFSATPKIGYAVSAGPIKKSTDYWNRYIEQIRQYKHISVREKCLEQQLKEATEKDVVSVLDPVFLLSQNEWKTVYSKHKKEISKPYMVCYFAGGVDKNFNILTKKICRKNGWSRILIMDNYKDLLSFDKKAYESGPIEFLALIDNAQMVCTNSFHGTAFSIIFNKNFIVDTWGLRDERIDTALELFGLEDRRVTYEKNIDNLTVDIDYTDVNSIKTKEIERSQKWLKKTLSDLMI